MNGIQITAQDLAQVQGRVGSAIDRHSNDRLTPTQAWKITAIVLSSLAIIAALACLTTAILFPIAFEASFLGALLLGAGAGWGIYYACTVKDLDNPTEREMYTQQIAQNSFSEIADQFTATEVLEYDLLSKVSPHNEALHACYSILDQIYRDSKRDYDRSVIRADTQYHRDMAPHERHTDRAQFASAVHASNRREREALHHMRGTRPGVGEDLLDGVVAGLNTYNTIDAVIDESRARRVYSEDRRERIDDANRNFSHDKAQLNFLWDTMKPNLVGFRA